MNTLSEAIEKAVKGCKEFGAGQEKLGDIEIHAAWEEVGAYDVITVYIYENDIIKFDYELEETAVLKS